MKLMFDVYGRFRLEVRRSTDGEWSLHRHGPDGKRSRVEDLVLPRDADPDEILDLIEIAYHELGAPGKRVRRV